MAVVVDIIQANLKKVRPNYRQHITCATSEVTLDHCDMTVKRCYKAASLPQFSKLDHAAIYLLLEYKQRVEREEVVTRVVRQLSDHVDNNIWDM